MNYMDRARKVLEEKGLSSLYSLNSHSPKDAQSTQTGPNPPWRSECERAARGESREVSEVTPAPAIPSPAPPWADLDTWCARLGSAGGLHARRAVLRAWVDAAGGWSDAAAIHVPASLPPGLPLATMKAHARALRLDVREDPDEPAHLRWLRGDQS